MKHVAFKTLVITLVLVVLMLIHVLIYERFEDPAPLLQFVILGSFILSLNHLRDKGSFSTNLAFSKYMHMDYTIKGVTLLFYYLFLIVSFPIPILLTSMVICTAWAIWFYFKTIKLTLHRGNEKLATEFENLTENLRKGLVYDAKRVRFNWGILYFLIILLRTSINQAALVLSIGFSIILLALLIRTIKLMGGIVRYSTKQGTDKRYLFLRLLIAVWLGMVAILFSPDIIVALFVTVALVLAYPFIEMQHYLLHESSHTAES